MRLACSACGGALHADDEVAGLAVCQPCGRFPQACNCTRILHESPNDDPERLHTTKVAA